ncbi:CAP domain-containing protein [Bacillus sp. FJAT-27251]|uniref:CAP domain-containing protein n=1 Tax=Bacillus sp. FJAT-27251 TaxID=1684142 RepID=UPI000A4DFD40
MPAIRKVGLLAAAITMTLALTACNADDNARGSRNESANGAGTYNINNYRPGRDNNLDVRNNGDRNGIDHNGPLTEDYRKEPGDFGFLGTRRSQNNAGANGTGNGIARNGQLTRNYEEGRDLRTQKIDEQEMNISSFRTSKSSDDYPHTRPILVREARYQYVPVDNDGRNWQEYYGQEQQQAMPNLEQGGQQAMPTPEQRGQQAAPLQEQQQDQQNTQGISQTAQQVIDLTNDHRRQNGLQPLEADPQLSGVALKKSEDMQENGYFSHTSPTYGSPFDMMRDFGVSYRTAGENIAQGQRSPQEVVNAWMNSPGHRQNILNPNYTHIGVGHAEAGNHWTQMFIGK